MQAKIEVEMGYILEHENGAREGSHQNSLRVSNRSYLLGLQDEDYPGSQSPGAVGI